MDDDGPQSSGLKPALRGSIIAYVSVWFHNEGKDGILDESPH
jgi:hypothetical protein